MGEESGAKGVQGASAGAVTHVWGPAGRATGRELCLRGRMHPWRQCNGWQRRCGPHLLAWVGAVPGVGQHHVGAMRRVLQDVVLGVGLRREGGRPRAWYSSAAPEWLQNATAWQPC